VQVVARVSAPMPLGLSGCTFDAEATLQGGVLVAAGPLAAAGQQYPVALVLRCLSPGGICTDSYLAVYNYSTAPRVLRCGYTDSCSSCRHGCGGLPTNITHHATSQAVAHDVYKLPYPGRHGCVLHSAGLCAERTCRRCARLPTLPALPGQWFVCIKRALSLLSCNGHHEPVHLTLACAGRLPNT
jgi:hypothetical protein